METVSQQMNSSLKLEVPCRPDANSMFESPLELHDSTLKINDLDNATGIANMLRDRHFTRIVALVGAGISVSAGIPDFRSAGGLYDQMKKRGFKAPESVFTTDFMEESPDHFYEIMRSLMVPDVVPTTTHNLLKLLHNKGMLLRCYTQNIDGLELKVGIPEDQLVEAHGTMRRVKCSKCQVTYGAEQLQCAGHPRCTSCSALLRPAIVFFGEPLPRRFSELAKTDLNNADLVLVMGTSLSVQPFASLVHWSNAPRIVLNMFLPRSFKSTPWHQRFRRDVSSATPDVHLLGKCDEAATWLATQSGWDSELKAIGKAPSAGKAATN